jgi:cell division protein FtsB
MRNLRFSWKYALVILGVFTLAYLVMDFNSRMAELRRLSVQKERVAAEVTHLANTQAALQTQIAYATSDDAVAQWAYEQGHMARPGDIPVIPVEPVGGTPAPTPVATVEQPVVSNWQMWLWLFFDEPPVEKTVISNQ